MAFVSADSLRRGGTYGESGSVPSADGRRNWDFGPDVFDRLLDLYRLPMQSDGFGLLLYHCRSLLLGVGMWPGPEGSDGHGTAERLLDSDVPDSVDVGAVTSMVSRILADDHVLDAVSCLLHADDPRWLIGNLVSAESYGADWGTIRSAIGFARPDRSPMMLELLGCRDGFLAWEPVMRMRSVLDPDGDPRNPGADDENKAINPAILSDFKHLLEGSGHTEARAKALKAMCRPPIAGVCATCHPHAAHQHPRVAAAIAGMKAMHGAFACGYGVPTGAISLLDGMDPDRDPDENLALMDAAETLLRAGCHAYDSCDDCDAILTGRQLADAIMEGLPAGFVAETAMAAG